VSQKGFRGIILTEVIAQVYVDRKFLCFSPEMVLFGNYHLDETFACE
jgi:hypothetical protein